MLDGRAGMSEDAATPMSEALEDVLPTNEVGELPRDWEFAERILRRLKPRNQQDVYDMAARQSKMGGMLITLMVVVWWLFIGMDQDDLTVGVSVFFELNFEQAALAVMGLSLFSAILTEFSRDMGKILPSTLAGGMLILSGLYVVEPLITALFLTNPGMELADGVWRSLRLGALWGGMTYGSNLLVNAMLLNWLIRFLDSNEYDFSGRGENSQDMQPRLSPLGE
jgi:ABC-type polysaccharide/polyol phosphate export permease